MDPSRTNMRHAMSSPTSSAQAIAALMGDTWLTTTTSHGACSCATDPSFVDEDRPPEGLGGFPCPSKWARHDQGFLGNHARQRVGLPPPHFGERWVLTTEQQAAGVLGGLSVTDENQHEGTVPVCSGARRRLRGGMLDDRDDTAGHEACRADDLAATGDLCDLDGPAGDEHVDAPSFSRRNDLKPANLVAGIDEDLDPVSLHRPQRLGPQRGTSPPSAISTWPVTKLPASDARNNAGPTISSGWAARRWRLAFAICSWASRVFFRIMSVLTDPGASALTRMPSGANSAAIDRVKEYKAAFAA